MKNKGALKKTMALLLSLGIISGPGAGFAAPDTGKRVQQPSITADDELVITGYYTIKKGDTLARISSRYLGSAERWREIVAANPGIDPKRMEVGTKIRMPLDANLEATIAALPRPKQPPVIFRKSVDDPGTNRAEKPDLSFLDSAAPKSILGSLISDDEGENSDHESEAQDFSQDEKSPENALTSRFINSELKLPEEIKSGKTSQYFANIKGFHGLFNTESAMFPENRALIVGLQGRYDKYGEFDFQGFNMSGNQWVMPLNILFLRNRLMAGLSVPVQAWEVNRVGIDNNVTFSGMHDPSLRLGYQIWRDYAGQQAVSLHFEGRFPSGNYHQPMLNMTGKTRSGVEVGPAEATRGSWLQIGGAYSRKLAARWNGHMNLTLASNPRDGIAKINPRAGLEYLLDPNCVLLAEVDAPSWSMEKGPDGSNIDMLLGLAWFNERWQFSVGMPVSMQSEWGYKRDYGLILGLNYRQD